MSPVVEVFVELARRYSHAVRRYDRVAAQGNRNEIDEAISNKQEIEAEVTECFMLVRTPAGMSGR